MELLEFYYHQIGTYPLIIKIALTFVLICILLVVSLFTFLWYFRYRKKREEKLIEKNEAFINEFLDDIVDENKSFSQEDIVNNFVKKIKKIDKLKDYILDRLVFKINNNVDYNVKNIKNFIKALNVDVLIEKKLDFSSTLTKTRAIQISAALNLNKIDSKILPYSYNKNKVIRHKARAAYLQLSRNNPYKFFNETTETFNKWNEISLLNSLKQNEKKGLPNFSMWISYSKNQSLIVFLIKMVGFFKQKDSVNILMEQLNNTNEEIREAAILALGELDYLESERKLKQIYYNQPDLCQIAIIKTLGKFQSLESLDFLKKSYIEATSFNTKKIIASEILNFGVQGKEIFQSLKRKQQEENDLILDHIENPLIYFKHA